MNWRELIQSEGQAEYHTARGLVDMLEESDLPWKPRTGGNWFTTAQLLQHMVEACGMNARGFVTGAWGLPDDFDPGQMSEEDMLPSAETYPAVSSLEEAKKMLEEDERLTLEMLSQVSDTDLDKKKIAAPWDSTERVLGYQLLQMVGHLRSHKHQLFYYLKLQGKPVHTGHLWGGPE